MRSLVIIFLLVTGIALPSSLAQSHHVGYPYERVLQLGDNQAWAKPDFNHKDWDYRGSTDSIGIFWVRFKIRGDSITDYFEYPGLQIVSLGSYELYWDGQLIGRNGVVGKTKSEEIPGKFLTQIPVNDSLLTPGIHTIAMRVSNFHTPDLENGSWNTLFMEEYQGSLKNDLILTAKIFILAGIYLMAALYYLFLFVLRHREKEVFIFSTLCFLFFGLIIMEYFKILYAYPYHWHFYRLLIIFLLTFLISFLTPYFLLTYFSITRRRLIAVCIFILLTLATILGGLGTDTTNVLLGIVMWLSSTAIMIYCTLIKKAEALLVLVVLIISGCIITFFNLGFASMLYSHDISVFIGFSLLVLSMMYLLAKRAREQKEAYEASLLLSSRLQNELLKKNIQPHFIMNTLTSLMSWVEESPKESVQFIEALSGEFEIMSDIAEKKLIPLEQEIELCQRHIEIMRFRKEIEYIFELENIPTGEMIPPAILHTIIENGITHNLPDAQNRVKMVLHFEESEQSKIYTLRAYGKNRDLANKKKGGAGIKYIKSRLAENYGTQWSLDSKPISEGWETKIVLFK